MGEFPVPYTDAQRRLFHSAEENPDVAREHGMTRTTARRLAEEADRLKARGREKRSPSPSASKSSDFVDLEPVFGGRR